VHRFLPSDALPILRGDAGGRHLESRPAPLATVAGAQRISMAKGSSAAGAPSEAARSQGPARRTASGTGSVPHSVARAPWKRANRSSREKGRQLNIREAHIKPMKVIVRS